MNRLGLGALAAVSLLGLALAGCNKAEETGATGDMAKPGTGMSQAQIEAMKASRQPPAQATQGGRPMGGGPQPGMPMAPGGGAPGAPGGK